MRREEYSCKKGRKNLQSEMSRQGQTDPWEGAETAQREH